MVAAGLGIRAKLSSLSSRVVVIVGRRRRMKECEVIYTIQCASCFVQTPLLAADLVAVPQLLRMPSNNNTTKRMEGSEFLQGNGRLWILWVHMIWVGPRIITLDSVCTDFFSSCWALYCKCVELTTNEFDVLVFSVCFRSVRVFFFFAFCIFFIIA
jgi:hypothetical protein